MDKAEDTMSREVGLHKREPVRVYACPHCGCMVRGIRHEPMGPALMCWECGCTWEESGRFFQGGLRCQPYLGMTDDLGSPLLHYEPQAHGFPRHRSWGRSHEA